MSHAEGLKTVGRVPMAQRKGLREGVGIKKGLVRWQMTVVNAGG